MAREHRIIDALAGSPVPVPVVVGLCEDASVNGAPFYVMEHVDGLVVRDQTIAATLDDAQRRRVGESLIDTLAAIHEVDVDAVGLGDLGRREGYLERQLKRWSTQFERSKLREVPAIDEVHARLQAERPPQQKATIVHGDYRLDNCIIDEPGNIAAVLDWELCTLGDPMADLGMLFVYSPDPGDPHLKAIPAPTAIDGFPRKRAMLARYAAQSDLDVGDIDYYVAFGMWKLACIAEGVYARYAGGAMGAQDDGTASRRFGDQVIALAERAREILDGRA
jgi:aminoglycoside phosphotransferase (APT) family kinase protein